MQDWLVRMSFPGPAHFGEAGIGQETTNVTVRSDSLYSAIWSVWARYGLDHGIDWLMERFLGPTPPFRLSSSFVFDQDTYYLPRPALPKAGLEQHGKTVKQTRYLPLDMFRAWAADGPVSHEQLKEANDRYDELYKITVRPRVALDRVSQRSNLFQMAQVSFAPGAGLWFLVRLHDPDLLRPLKQALAILGEDGLGGRRTAGSGYFTPSWDEVTATDDWQAILRDDAGTGPCCLLSLCNPRTEELPTLLDGAAYEVVERRGWAASGPGAQAPRRAVRMLTEGSVLARQPLGQVLDVTPPGFTEVAGHPVYRSGLALAVPVRREGAG